MKWNTILYDSKHEFVSKYGEEVIKLLAPQQGENILDLGCGTGDLADLITKSGANVIGFDNSIEMISRAKEKYPTIDFRVASADNFDFGKNFDAIFSNATLHWVLEKQKTVECIYKSLKIGGRFVAEFGGKGNVANIVDALKQSLNRYGYSEIAGKTVWYFPSLSEYATLLEDIGFRVTFATHFDRPTLLKDNDGIKNWVNMFGKPFLESIDDNIVKVILDEVEEQVTSTNFHDNNWYADYIRLRIMAIK